VDGALVERVVDSDATPCLPFAGYFWVVAPLNDLPCALRLARDPGGHDLLPTERELAAQALRAAGDALRVAEDERDAALPRIAELEAELRKKGGA
jgi:hypothetical protein